MHRKDQTGTLENDIFVLLSQDIWSCLSCSACCRIAVYFGCLLSLCTKFGILSFVIPLFLV